MDLEREVKKKEKELENLLIESESLFLVWPLSKVRRTPKCAIVLLSLTELTAPSVSDPCSAGNTANLGGQNHTNHIISHSGIRAQSADTLNIMRLPRFGAIGGRRMCKMTKQKQLDLAQDVRQLIAALFASTPDPKIKAALAAAFGKMAEARLLMGLKFKKRT